MIITLDTTRPDALGSYGQPRDVTPNIDRMAEEGVLFEHADVSSPSTLPSHSSLFTGKQPYSHGARSNLGYVLSKDNITLAEVLRDAGYRTRAEVAAIVLNRETLIRQGFETSRDPKSSGVALKQVLRAGDTERSEHPVRVASDVAKSGIKFIRKNRDREFFLWLHFFDAHNPHAPRREFRSKFPGEPYLAEIAGVDREVGGVLDEIRRLGLREKTLVVLTSDHGEGLGEHGEVTHSYFIYQSTMHAPLIFWGPTTLRGGTRVASLVRTIDVTPTVLDLLGLPALEDVEGVSLKGLLTGQQQEVDLLSYGESLELSHAFAVSPLRFIREGKWKYIHKVNPELYDLTRDPKELTNRAAAEPERVAYFQQRLAEMLASAEPSRGDSLTVLDDATRAQLVALGYTAPVAVSTIENEVESLAVEGTDPSSKSRDVEILARAQGFLIAEKYEEAHVAFTGLLERTPDSAHLLGLMGKVLEGLERYDEAEASYRKAIAIVPNSTDYNMSLIAVLEEQGRVDEAVEPMMAVWERDPCSDVTIQLATQLHDAKDYPTQMQTLSRSAEACPDHFELLNNYAWALATVPEASHRDGAKAVKVARLAISQLPDEPGPEYLDTLAASLAEAGDFAAATATIQEAIQAARRLGYPDEVLEILNGHLEHFKQGKVPYE